MKLIKSKKLKHLSCRRCGLKAYSRKKRYCVSCRFGKSPKFRAKVKRHNKKHLIIRKKHMKKCCRKTDGYS